MGRPVPTHVTPFQIKDGLPKEEDVEVAFRQMIRNREGRYMHLQAAHFKMWLMEV